ncbi:Cysteine proteinase inhibitor 5 [Linum perenne]
MMTIFTITFSVVEAIPGGWEPIKDLKDKHVIEIAEFAVNTYNGQISTEKLKLVHVDNGECQVVSGMNYKLTLTAIEHNFILADGEQKQYEAIVYEDLSQLKKLISFIQLK